MLALLLPVFSMGEAEASWLIDPAKFHASAHGRTACTDCHFNVPDQPLHPNPANVTEKEKRIYDSDQCLDCHDDIGDELDEGIHGSRKIKDREKYRQCLTCHHWPHKQPFLGAGRPKAFKPRRPVETQCGACHEKMSVLPPFEEEDAACMKCHQTRESQNPQDVQAIEDLCFHCHGKGRTQAQVATSERIPLMDEASYGKTPHESLACTDCHTTAASYEHRQKKPVNCLLCHRPHIMKDTHGAHQGISCQVCHLKGIEIYRDAASHRLRWKMERDLKDLTALHQMGIHDGENACNRCHFPGNGLGASSMVLPPKSILCMPCHAATFSLSDTVSITAFIIFICGMVLFLTVLLTGSMNHISSKNPLLKLLKGLFDMLRAIFSPGIVPILKALFWDAFLQRRLYKRSPKRWFIHGLIFYPFAFRFFWGVLALLGSLWEPDNHLVWDMIDNNNPLVAFLFDFTGLMMLTGILLAWIRGSLERRNRKADASPQDRIALCLIGGIVVIGFLLEGMRIVMTGRPGGAGYSFLGYWISFLFSGSRGLPDIYSFTWYVHAVLTGAFIAYIPFSRLLHMILAPIVISINAVSRNHGMPHELPGSETMKSK